MSAFRKALFGPNCKAVAKVKKGDGEIEGVTVTGILSSDKEEFVQAVKDNGATLTLSVKDGDDRTRSYSNKEPNRSEAAEAAREVLGMTPKKSSNKPTPAQVS